MIAPTSTQPTIHVYTDGACSGNPGPMGVGAVVYVEHGAVAHSRAEVSDYKGHGTNQQAELMAVDAGLLHVSIHHGCNHDGWKAKTNHALRQGPRARERRQQREGRRAGTVGSAREWQIGT